MEALIDSIYRVAFEPTHWPVLMAELALFCDVPTTYLFSPPLPGTESNPLGPLFGHNFDRDTVAKLLEDYSDQDCVSGAVFAAVNNDYRYVSGFSRSSPTTEILKSTYRNECMRGCGTGDMMALMMRPMQTNGGNPTICVAMPWGGNMMTQSQADRLQSLAPHFHRLGRLTYDVLPNAPIDPTLGHNLDHMPVAAMLLRETGKVIHMNPASERAMAGQSGLHIRDGHLIPIKQSERMQLERLIDSATRILPGGARCGGEMTVSDQTGAAMTVLVVPLGGDNPFVEAVGPCRAAIYLLPHNNTSAFPGKLRLSQLFGLTGAEAEVAFALIGGISPEEIAITRERSITTIRSQIRVILEKTSLG